MKYLKKCNENYLDAEGAVAPLQNGDAVETEAGQRGTVDRVEIVNADGKKITRKSLPEVLEVFETTKHDLGAKYYIID